MPTDVQQSERTLQTRSAGHGGSGDVKDAIWLRTNLTENDPALLWQYYTRLVAVEEAFKNLKGDLAIRPIFHQQERRVEVHIFIAFLAYCLQITLQRRLHALAPGLTGRSVLAPANKRSDSHSAKPPGYVTSRPLVAGRYQCGLSTDIKQA